MVAPPGAASRPDVDSPNVDIPDALQTGQNAAAGSIAARSLDGALRRFLRAAVVLLTSGYIFLDYWNYSRTFHDGGGAEWEALLAGRGFAPAQYRVGVLTTAALLARLTHTGLRHMFALIDFVSLGVGLGVLLWLLTRTEIFRRASRLGQWLQSTMALSCFLLYLLWSFWYQKPETHATLLLLALSAAAAAWRQRAAGAVCLVLLAALGATVRADALVAFHLGFLAVCLLPQARTLPLGRGLQAGASLLAVVAAGGVQYGIMHGLYPHAPRQVAAVQLMINLTSWLNYGVLACALFPWWITLRLAGQHWRSLDGWSAGLLLGSVVHFILFFTLGLSTEVRVFLPFAMTLVPLTVTLAAARIHRAAAAD